MVHVGMNVVVMMVVVSNPTTRLSTALTVSALRLRLIVTILPVVAL